MADSEKTVCWDCFYKFRTNPYMFCKSGGEREACVTWNEEMERYETTGKSIRPFPEGLRGRVKSYVAMCDPYKGTCRKEQCTFAHGKAEQEAWNKILKDSSVKDKGIVFL